MPSRRDNNGEDLPWIWHGEPLNSKSDSSKARATRHSGRSNLTFYQSAKRGPEIFSVGDCVLVYNDKDETWAAMIKALWQDERKQKVAKFRWFSRMQDILPDAQLKHTSWNQNQVFYTKWDDNNSLVTIQRKCQILSLPKYRQIRPDMPKQLTNDDIFFCQSAYVSHKKYVELDWDTFYSQGEWKDASTDVMFEQTGHAAKRQKTTHRVEVEDEVPSEGDEERESADEFEYVGDKESDNEIFEDTKMDEDEEQATRKRVVKQTRKKTRLRKSKVTVGKTPGRKYEKFSFVIPKREVAIDTDGLTAFEIARARLHVSAVPETLPCREEEFAEIISQLESAIEEGVGSCIYISGVPGTGKTATVHEVIRHLQYKADQEQLPPFQFVEINGMKLTEPTQAYSILWESIAQTRVTASHALDLLDKNFNTQGPRQFPCVVLMDELDLLVTKKQDVMYNFFEWPNRTHSKLIVVAVANTMDLPERMLSAKIASRIGLTRINFQPYNHTQLMTIISSRLSGVKAFEKEAIEFASRKVSAVSGDARRALDICRRAVEIVETRLKTQKDVAASVTIPIINEAIREMFSSPNVTFVRHASLHQKIFILSLLQVLRRKGLAEADFGEVTAQHSQLCRWHHLEVPTTAELAEICAGLGAARCLVVEGGRLDITQRLGFCVSEEDVVMALKDDPFFKKFL